MKIEFLNYEPLITLFISIVALILSLIALYYTIKSFLLKSGHNIRCDISTCSTIECNDNYVSSITLENIKDRATVIFTIYLKLGRSNYLVLEDFKEKPLILKPFEIYHKEYGPLILYSASLKRVNLNNLLNNRKIYRKIILSTTDGKYIVKANTKKWSPISQFFKNYLTAIIYPQRFKYEGIYYGNNVKYLVELKKTNGNNIVIAIHDGDHRLKKFTKFDLTKESLKSVENLDVFFRKQKLDDKISFDEVKIIDFRETVKNIQSEYDSKISDIEAHSFFKYNILGKLYTFLENKKMTEKNRKLRVK